MIIQGQKVTPKYSQIPILEEVSFQINQGDQIGLIGGNGSGKSTLLRLLTREEKPDEGIITAERGQRLSYMSQQPVYPREATVLTYLLSGFQALKEQQKILTEYEREMARPGITEGVLANILTKYGHIQQMFAESGGYGAEDRCRSLLKGVGLSGKEARCLDTLSGGEKMRVELCRALVHEADLYLLDEPTNHLDEAGLRWLADYLRGNIASFIVTSHDRYFLNEVATKIFALEDGQLTQYKGHYDDYKKQRAEELAARQKDYDWQQKELHRLNLSIRRFRQWGNEGDNEKFFKKAKELERRIEKMEVLKRPQEAQKKIQHTAIHSSRSRKEVFIAENLSAAVGERVLFTGANFVIRRGDRIILTGKNGTGKSSFLKVILGELIPHAGSARLGAAVKIGYLPQKIVFPKEQERVLQYTASFTPNEEAARCLLAKYGFYVSDVGSRLEDLSGGERVRLYLAQLLQQEINFLILDEPTNHLDIPSREEIEALLAAYTGTLMVVSHDQYFTAKYFTKELRIEEQRLTLIDRS